MTEETIIQVPEQAMRRLLSEELDEEQQKKLNFLAKLEYKTYIFLQKYNQSFLKNKSQHCKHEYGCFFHIVKMGFRNFSIGYLVQMFLNVLSLLLKPKQLKKGMGKKLFKTFFSREAIKFGIFPMIFTMVQKIIFCVGRRFLNGDSGTLSFLSGFIAGFLSLAVKTQKNRLVWAIFLLSRAVDAMYWSFIRNKYQVKFKYDYLLYFASLNLLTGYAYAVEPSLVSNGLFKFYKFMANHDISEVGMMRIWRLQVNNLLKSRGIDTPDASYNYL